MMPNPILISLEENRIFSVVIDCCELTFTEECDYNFEHTLDVSQAEELVKELQSLIEIAKQTPKENSDA